MSVVTTPSKPTSTSTRPTSGAGGHDIVHLEPGPVDERRLLGEVGKCFGVWVLDGLIVVELEAARARTAWLIGEDDLIRPWEIAGVSLNKGRQWRVLSPARVLPLGAGFYRRVREDPAVLHGVLARATRSAHWLLARTLIAGAANVETRLVLLFELWSERWGRVTPDGIRIELPLTHELIAKCCGTRRPTVTLALQTLQRRSVLARISHTEWLLTRNPRTEDDGGCGEQYSQAIGLDFSGQPSLTSGRPAVSPL